jgi:probable lipoprotein NlpC
MPQPMRLSPRWWLLCSLCLLLQSCFLFRKKSQPTSTHTPAYTPPSKGYSAAKVRDIIATARAYNGVPYRYGGADASGFDCSGLILAVYQQHGYALPRVSWEQANMGYDVSMSEIKPGDWVFFVTSKTGGVVNHAGIVTEVNGPQEILFIHASTSRGVREDNLFSNYWKAAFAKAVRPFD